MALTLRPGTLEQHRGNFDRHVKPYLGQKKLTQLTAADLRELYRTLLERGRIGPRRGGSTPCCRPLIACQQRRAGLSTAARMRRSF